LPGGGHAFAEPGGLVFGNNRPNLPVTNVSDEQLDGIGSDINHGAAHTELLPVPAVRRKRGKPREGDGPAEDDGRLKVSRARYCVPSSHGTQ